MIRSQFIPALVAATGSTTWKMIDEGMVCSVQQQMTGVIQDEIITEGINMFKIKRLPLIERWRDEKIQLSLARLTTSPTHVIAQSKTNN